MRIFTSIAKERVMIQPYSRLDMKRTLEKNLLRALAFSIVLHTAIISGYYVREFVVNDDDAPIVNVRLLKYSELGPPPSIVNAEQLPVVGISASVAKPSIGVPVPVPDLEVNPEQTIASQQELSQIQSPVAAEAATNTGVQVQQDIKIDDDPSPDAFIPVEKIPVAIKQVEPPYPEIARRTGVEGVVWVKVLVDKMGKVKKALVMKSDAEIFNEPATEAAMQWVFTPAVMNNGPVVVWVAIPFRFQINKISS